MKIECPKCHNSLECESKWCGQKAQCPYCSNKFIITEIMLEPIASKGGSKWLRALLALLCIAAGVGLGHVLFAPGGKAGSPLKTAPETATASTEIKKSDAAEVAADAAVDAPADAKTEKSDATAENNTETSRTGEQSSEEATISAEGDNYTYEYYDGVYVPYYRGYYYIGGAWVWHGHGKAPFPPPRVRPILRTAPVPVKSPTAKAVPAKTRQSSQTTARVVKNNPAPVKAAPTKTVQDNPIPDRPATNSSAPAKQLRVKRAPAKSAPRHGGGRSSAPRGRR